MADIKVTAYLNKIKTTLYGTVFEIGERHSKKNQETGEWEKDGENTYYDVWVDRAENFQADAFAEGQLIKVEGRFRTKAKKSQDGNVYKTNVINANSVQPFERQAAATVPDTWAEIPADAPF